MKKLLRKNQIIISALVIMVAVAGYLSLSEDDALQSVMDTAGISESLNPETDISDEDITVAQEGEDSVATGASSGAVTTSNTAQTGKENAGEAVMVGNNVSGSYFESAKLSREQTRAKNKETLLELVNNTNATEKQKENAMN